MKRLYVLLTKKLRLLFDFRQPHFRRLDCIDVVLEKKLLLLISWDTEHATKICIQPGKIIYRSATSAAICRLPQNTDTVDIILSNWWRSRKETFNLKRIEADEQILKYLDRHLIARLKLFIEKPELSAAPVYLSNPIDLTQFSLHIHLPMQMPLINISINQHQLNDYAP